MCDTATHALSNPPTHPLHLQSSPVLPVCTKLTIDGIRAPNSTRLKDNVWHSHACPFDATHPHAPITPPLHSSPPRVHQTDNGIRAPNSTRQVVGQSWTHRGPLRQRVPMTTKGTARSHFFSFSSAVRLLAATIALNKVASDTTGSCSTRHRRCPRAHVSARLTSLKRAL